MTSSVLTNFEEYFSPDGDARSPDTRPGRSRATSIHCWTGVARASTLRNNPLAGSARTSSSGTCAVLFIDHQPQMFFGVANMPMRRLASPDETAETIVFTIPTD
jgi:hypothetical protein